MTLPTSPAPAEPGAPWPRWCDRLPATPGRRAEGGLRLGGQLKASAPGAPLVSYITVVRNGEKTLARTLQSVREQSWPQVEHIVVDGLSTDGTLALIEQHAGQIDYYVSEPDAGLYDALNKAVPLARGELICVLNADDWLTTDAARLAATAHGTAGREARQLVLSAAWAMEGGRRTLWSPGRLDLGSYLSCANVCHNGVYATPAAYAASGPYATTLRIAADFRWLVRCADAGVQTVVVDEPTVHYAMGGMSSEVQRHTRECLQVLRERFPALSEAEAWGLLHAFHLFAPNLQPFAASRPPHLGRFLGQLARDHAGDPALMTALCLAGMGLLHHPADGAPPGRATRAEKARRSLRKRWLKLRALWRR